MKKSTLVTLGVAAMVSVGDFVLVGCANEEPKSAVAEQPTTTPARETDTIQFTNSPADSSSADVLPSPRKDDSNTSKEPQAITGKKATGQTSADAKTAAAAPVQKTDADIEAGKQLLATSDCLTCHKTQEKLVGPSYADVAKKYADNGSNLRLLVGKIINGGGGVWGQIPMTPHATLAEEDAMKMVKYILSLN